MLMGSLQFDTTAADPFLTGTIKYAQKTLRKHNEAWKNLSILYGPFGMLLDLDRELLDDT